MVGRLVRTRWNHAGVSVGNEWEVSRIEGREMVRKFEQEIQTISKSRGLKHVKWIRHCGYWFEHQLIGEDRLKDNSQVLTRETDNKNLLLLNLKS